jgi:hypothetical protein
MRESTGHVSWISSQLYHSVVLVDFRRDGSLQSRRSSGETDRRQSRKQVHAPNGMAAVRENRQGNAPSIALVHIRSHTA